MPEDIVMQPNTRSPELRNVLGSRAVVIGSGIAGLSAAASLAEYFEAVTLLDRDRDLSSAEPRRGVPQGRQPHLLLCGGAMALEQLFPGFQTDLVQVGGLPYSAPRDLLLEIPGIGNIPQREMDFRSVAAQRPQIERVLATRLAANRRIVVREEARAIRIATTANGSRVTGVEYITGDGAYLIEGAELVVDASGQGALTLQCLQETRRTPPPSEVVGVDIGYASALFQLREPAAGDFVAMMTHAVQGSSRMGYMIKVSPDTWQVLLVGRGNDRPPARMSEFFDFASSLGTQTVADLLRLATRSQEIARFRFPASLQRRFTRGSEPPAGLLPIGDAICRFNPVYGQGMTVAAQEALLLQTLLEQQAPDPDWAAELTQRYLAGCATIVDTAWAYSVIPDFAYPETTGTPPPDLQDQLKAQVEQMRHAIDDEEAQRAFVIGRHLLKPFEPGGLLHRAMPRRDASDPARLQASRAA